MTLADKDGREVEIQIGGAEVDEAYITEAYYSDNGDEPPEHVLDWLQANYAGEIFDEWVQVQVAKAEWMADAWKDGTRD